VLSLFLASEAALLMPRRVSRRFLTEQFALASCSLCAGMAVSMQPKRTKERTNTCSAMWPSCSNKQNTMTLFRVSSYLFVSFAHLSCCTQYCTQCYTNSTVSFYFLLTILTIVPCLVITQLLGNSLTRVHFSLGLILIGRPSGTVLN